MIIIIKIKKLKVLFFMGCSETNKKNPELEAIANRLKNEAPNIEVVIWANNIDNLFTLKFESGNQMINCYILCKQDDIFNTLVNKVFEKTRI